MSRAQYELRVMTQRVKVTLDDRSLVVKQGPFTKEALVQDLRHLYVISHMQQGVESFSELVLAHQPTGKSMKRLRVSANGGDPGMRALIQGILDRRPEIDIRSMPEKDAHSLMGSTNFKHPLWIGAIVVGALIFLTVLAELFGRALDGILK